MFGGCNNTYTAFNDLWLFDLVFFSRFWPKGLGFLCLLDYELEVRLVYYPGASI